MKKSAPRRAIVSMEFAPGRSTLFALTLDDARAKSVDVITIATPLPGRHDSKLVAGRRVQSTARRAP